MQIYRTLITAAIAASVSTSAFALIEDSKTGGTAGGSGELFWVIMDEQGERTYTRDLGINLDNFLAAAATGQSWSYANDATLVEFIAGTANPGRLVWNLAALDSTGSGAGNFQKFLSSYAVGSTPPTFTNLAVTNLDNGADIFLSSTNTLGTHPTQQNGSNIAVPADGFAYGLGGTWGTNFGGNAASFNNAIAIDGTSSLFLIRQASNVFGNRFQPGIVSELKFNTQPYEASFNGSELKIMPVPEPGTYAMMGVGLAALGFAARRRNKR
jgi:hypothetical protein